jgi:ketosteroid isomerase-like protein
VQAAYSSFARGDLPGLLAVVSDRIIWDATDALWAKGTFFGHDGVREYFGQLEALWEGLRLEDYEIEMVRPGTLLVRGRLRGRERATGLTADASFLHWLDVADDGKIGRLRILVDPDRR